MTFSCAYFEIANVTAGNITWNHSGEFARTPVASPKQVPVCTLVRTPGAGPTVALEKRSSNIYRNRERFSKTALKKAFAGVREARLAESKI